jgi:hypothetical protein
MRVYEVQHDLTQKAIYRDELYLWGCFVLVYGTVCGMSLLLLLAYHGHISLLLWRSSHASVLCVSYP